MATKNVTFDPDSGVPFSVNLDMYSGADFTANFNILNTANSAFDLSGYSGSSQMSKSVAIGATLGASATFTVGFTSAADGKMKISLGSTSTRDLSQGRYGYTVLVSSGSTLYNLVNGQIYVYPGIASAP
jgi:hypothetical protein|tara:strand:- start:1554 stop:1940 length:387 start_codon:yes stop_codon:yes gene_type:complete